MATLEAETPAKGFEGLDIGDLEARRERLASQWVTAVKGETDKMGDGAFVEAGITPEKMEEVDRIRSEFDLIVDTLKAARTRKQAANYAIEVENLTSGTRFARDRQARVDAKAWQNVLKAGRKDYMASGKLADYVQNPGEVDLGQPCIAMNPQRGVNEVMPFPFVSADWRSGDETVQLKSLEASFRYAEITMADKQGLYDPVDGSKVDGHRAPVGRERLEADLSTTGSTYSLTTIGGQLYTYMVQENELISICKIIQSPNINVYHVIRRNAVPNAVPMAEGGAVGTSDSTFIANLQLTPRKYGFIKQYTYETTMQAEPWSMAQLVAMDSGIGLRNGIGAHLVTGNNNDSSSNQIQGIKHFIDGAGGTTMRHSGVVFGRFLGGSTLDFGVAEMAAFATSIPKEYLKSPNKRLVMPLRVWGQLMGLEDGEQRKLFSSSNMNVDDLQLTEYSVRVLLDENLDGATANVNAADQTPMLFGDFDGFCVLLAGGPRMDFSTEYGFANDRLSLRTLQHVASGVVDTNTIRAYRTTS